MLEKYLSNNKCRLMGNSMRARARIFLPLRPHRAPPENYARQTLPSQCLNIFSELCLNKKIRARA